jgi:hypothetical protein
VSQIGPLGLTRILLLVLGESSVDPGVKTSSGASMVPRTQSWLCLSSRVRQPEDRDGSTTTRGWDDRHRGLGRVNGRGPRALKYRQFRWYTELI